jgi:hypothetical protein
MNDDDNERRQAAVGLERAEHTFALAVFEPIHCERHIFRC